MRSIFITILSVALVVTVICSLTLPSLNGSGKAVKNRTEDYYRLTIQN